MPGRWRGGCPQDDDPPRCAGNLAFVTLYHQCQGNKVGEPVLIGRASTLGPLGELASNRAGHASIEDWASIKHSCSYWRLLSAAPLAQWTRASATCSISPPHLLSGRGRLPLVQWLQISHRPTCSVDAGVCHLLSGAPIPGRQSRVPCPGGNPNLDKNLDKELGQVLSRVFLLQSHLSKFARGTWTRNLDNCGLPCYKLSQYFAPIPGRPRFRVPLSLEGVSQMDSILPERLPALVRPAFDLVLRRI